MREGEYLGAENGLEVGDSRSKKAVTKTKNKQVTRTRRGSRRPECRSMTRRSAHGHWLILIFQRGGCEYGELEQLMTRTRTSKDQVILILI